MRRAVGLARHLAPRPLPHRSSRRTAGAGRRWPRRTGNRSRGSTSISWRRPSSPDQHDLDHRLLAGPQRSRSGAPPAAPPRATCPRSATGRKRARPASVASARKSSRSSSTGTPNGRISGVARQACRPAPTGSATVISPLTAILRRSLIVAPSAGRMTSPSSTSRPTRSSPIFSGARGQPDQVAVALDDGLGDAMRQARSAPARRMCRVSPWTGTMISRPDPVVHLRELGPARDGRRRGRGPAAR